VCPNSGEQLFAVRRDEQRQRDGSVEPGTGARCRDRQTGTPDAVGHRQSGTKRQFVWKTVRKLGEYTRPHKLRNSEIAPLQVRPCSGVVHKPILK